MGWANRDGEKETYKRKTEKGKVTARMPGKGQKGTVLLAIYPKISVITYK